ncbi:MAG: hypothetical protein U0325_29315 [Polyangiales bacterium]
MSFIHFVLVGHFDWKSHGFKDRRLVRSIDPGGPGRILSEFPIEVAKQVHFSDGCVRCQWAPSGGARAADVRAFAYRLAYEEGCMALENGREVFYPPDAVQAWWAEIAPVSQAGNALEQAQRTQDEVEAILRWRREA